MLEQWLGASHDRRLSCSDWRLAEHLSNLQRHRLLLLRFLAVAISGSIGLVRLNYGLVLL